MTDRILTGVFPDRESAERAWSALVARGVERADVNLVMSEDTRSRHFADAPDLTIHTEIGSKAAEGAGIGGAIGGTVGAIAAAVAAVGTSLVLPGLGLVVAGPLAAALAGAGAGGAAGGLVGALVGWGFPEERVAEVESDLRDGAILMGVRVHDDEDALVFENAWRAAERREANA